MGDSGEAASSFLEEENDLSEEEIYFRPKRRKLNDTLGCFSHKLTEDECDADDEEEEEVEDEEEEVEEGEGGEVEEAQEAEAEAEADDTLTIDSLFDEILQKVFTYFPADHVWVTLSTVCKRWERVAKDPMTMNHTQLFLEDKDPEPYVKVLQEAPCIGEVYVLPSHPPNILQHLVHGPKIRELVIIGDSEWTPNWPSAKVILSILANNIDSLEKLSMHLESSIILCHHENPGIPSFQYLLAGMSRLTHLHLVGECWSGWDPYNFFGTYPPLEAVKLESTNFPAEDCPYIRDLLKLCKETLIMLCLPHQHPQDAINLMEAGVFEGSLIEDLTVTTGCVRVVSQMQQLKRLNVGENGNEDTDMTWFRTSPMLSSVNKLTVSNIWEDEDTKEGFMWQLFAKFNNVKEFWALQSCVNTDTFNMFIKNNPIREIYFFDFNGFDHQDQVPLLEKYLPNLRILDLSLTHISEEMCIALRALNARRPRLKICYGDDHEHETEEVIRVDTLREIPGNQE